jgi:hypothetical protein
MMFLLQEMNNMVELNMKNNSNTRQIQCNNGLYCNLWNVCNAN